MKIFNSYINTKSFPSACDVLKVTAKNSRESVVLVSIKLVQAPKLRVSQVLFEHLLHRFATSNWPSHSPHLTAPNFCLWRYSKKRIYVNKSATIQEPLYQYPRRISSVTAGIYWEYYGKCFQNIPFLLDLKWRSFAGLNFSQLMQISKLYVPFVGMKN